MSCAVCGLSPSLTLTWLPLFLCLPPLLSICSLTPHSPPASCTLLFLPTLQHLRPTILTNFEPLACHCLSHSLRPSFPYFCFCSVTSPPSLFIPYISLDYSFLCFFSFPSPSLCPVLSLSHSSLSPADSSWISVHRDHMTISPIGSPPPPMSSYRLAPFPAKSRRAALASLCRPSGRAVRHAAPLVLYAGLDLFWRMTPCCPLKPGEPIGQPFKDFLFAGHPVTCWTFSTESGTSLSLNILWLFWYKLKHVKLTFTCSAVLCKEKHIRPMRMSAASSFPFTTVRMRFHPFEGGTCWELNMAVNSQDTALMWAVRRWPCWTKETHWWICVLQRFTHAFTKSCTHTHSTFLHGLFCPYLIPFTHTVVWVAPRQLRMRFTQIKGCVSDLSAEAPDKSKQDESTDVFTSSSCFLLSDGCSFAKNWHEIHLIRQSQATDCRWHSRFVFCTLFKQNTLCCWQPALLNIDSNFFLNSSRKG